MQKTSNEAIYRILDFSDCKYLGEVHKEIQKKLELPKWYGCNSDALWDSLTGIMTLPAHITIIYKPNTDKISDLSEEIERIISVFYEAANEYNEFVLNVER